MTNVDAIMDKHGEYASVDELFPALIEDGFTAAGADAWIMDFDAMRLEEWARQSASEIAAENAWLVYAERSDPESEADLRLHESLWPDGYGV